MLATPAAIEGSAILGPPRCNALGRHQDTACSTKHLRLPAQCMQLHLSQNTLAGQCSQLVITLRTPLVATATKQRN